MPGEDWPVELPLACRRTLRVCGSAARPVNSSGVASRVDSSGANSCVNSSGAASRGNSSGATSCDSSSDASCCVNSSGASCPTTRHSRKLNVTGGNATRHAWSILSGIA